MRHTVVAEGYRAAGPDLLFLSAALGAFGVLGTTQPWYLLSIGIMGGDLPVSVDINAFGVAECLPCREV